MWKWENEWSDNYDGKNKMKIKSSHKRANRISHKARESMRLHVGRHSFPTATPLKETKHFPCWLLGTQHMCGVQHKHIGSHIAQKRQTINGDKPRIIRRTFEIQTENRTIWNETTAALIIFQVIEINGVR